MKVYFVTSSFMFVTARGGYFMCQCTLCVQVRVLLTPHLYSCWFSLFILHFILADLKCFSAFIGTPKAFARPFCCFVSCTRFLLDVDDEDDEIFIRYEVAPLVAFLGHGFQCWCRRNARFSGTYLRFLWKPDVIPTAKELRANVITGPLYKCCQAYKTGCIKIILADIVTAN